MKPLDILQDLIAGEGILVRAQQREIVRLRRLLAEVCVDSMRCQKAAPIAITTTPELPPDIGEPLDVIDHALLSKCVAGALAQAINAHGPVTMQNLPSATKRIVGACSVYNNNIAQKRAASPTV